MIIINLVISVIVAVTLLLDYGNNKIFDVNHSKILKAVLPYGVILGHISAYNSQHFNIAIIGSFIVGVFFFMSAYGLEFKRQNGLIKFKDIGSRLSKLLLPLLIPALLYICVLLFQDYNAWSVILNNFYTYQFILPFTWFIIILSFFYIIFYIALSIQDISNKKFICVVLITICVFSIVNFILFRETAAYTNFSSLCFPAGIFYKQHEDKISNFLDQKYRYLICLFFLMITAFLSNINYLLPITILLWSILIVMMTTMINVKGSIIIDYFSSISYEVYICQGITFLLLPPRFDKLPCLLHIICTFIITILIATLCNYFTLSLKKLFKSK